VHELEARYQKRTEILMPDETSDGGFELMRIIANLGGVVLGGLVVLIEATIIVGLDWRSS
jgi:hypothetical protein